MELVNIYDEYREVNKNYVDFIEELVNKNFEGFSEDFVRIKIIGLLSKIIIKLTNSIFSYCL